VLSCISVHFVSRWFSVTWKLLVASLIKRELLNKKESANVCTPEPTWRKTQYIQWMVLGISKLTKHRLFAPFCPILVVDLWCGWSWHAVSGCQGFTQAFLYLAHTDICATLAGNICRNPLTVSVLGSVSRRSRKVFAAPGRSWQNLKPYDYRAVLFTYS